MDTPKVGSPRSTDSPRRLPDIGAAPLSPRSTMPSVLNRECDQILLSLGKNDSLSQLVFEVIAFTDSMSPLIDKECVEAGAPDKAGDLKDLTAQISVGFAHLESAFEKTDLDACLCLLKAAKGNQVRLLADIDGLKQNPDGRNEFSEAHKQCKALGPRIVALMQVITQRLTAEQSHQQQMPLRFPRPSSPLTLSPRPSSPAFTSNPEKVKNKKTKKTDAVPLQSHGGQGTPSSPERGTGNRRLEKMPSPKSGKRAQGDEDSPNMKNSPAKRHKAQDAEQTASLPSQAASGATMHSSNTTDSSLRIRPGSPSKVPKFDWSSAKPATTGPHSALSMTPRTARQARTESEGNEKQGADIAPSLSSTPSSDAGTGKDVNEHPSSTPASPSSLPSPSNLSSPRKRQLSPSKSIPPQPRPRPSSMLFASPPVPYGLADAKQKVAEKTRDSTTTTSQVPPSTLISTSTVTTPSVTNVTPREEDTAHI